MAGDGDRTFRPCVLCGPSGPPVNLSEVVTGTIKAEGTANATGDKQRACLP